MNKYQEFQAKREQIKEYSLFHSNRDVSQKYYNLLAEVLEEFKKLEDIVMEDIMKTIYPSDREGIQDLDGGYQAYLEEYGLDGYNEREEVYYRDELEEDDYF